MDGVFVREDDRSDVKFYVLTKKDRIKVYSPEEYSKLKQMDKADCEECHVQLKPLTWAKSCQLQAVARVIDPATNLRIFSPDAFVQAKLKAIISSWSFKIKNLKEEEVPVKVCSENIDCLHPFVADYILKEYAERYEMSEETRKNS